MSTVTSRSNATYSAFLSIRALADPGTLSRLIEPFAKRGLVLSAVNARSAGPNGSCLQVDLQIDGLDRAVVETIADGLRQFPVVERVLVGECKLAGAVA